jgi:hypothetical protein
MGDVQPIEATLAMPVVEQSDSEVAVARNYFLKLLPDAELELRRILKMSNNEKLRKETAMDIVELAGAGGGPKTAPVVINADQVNLLLQVGREVLNGK